MRQTLKQKARSKMQNEQDFYSQLGDIGPGYDLSVATASNADLFSYPMSAPATAPAYVNVKSFWDSNGNMGDMSMDFSVDPFTTSGEWSHMDNHFNPSVNAALSQQTSTSAPGKQRLLQPKPPASSVSQAQASPAFDFNIPSMSEDSISMPSGSAVNPNLIFSFSNSASSNITFNPLKNQAILSSSTSQNQEPVNPMPATQRSQSIHEKRAIRPLRTSSPVKGYRPGARRATADNLARPPALKPAVPLNSEQPPANFAGKGKYSSGKNTNGRLSPIKQGSTSNLPAIFETAPGTATFNPRTSVTFSIDASGRATAQTTVIMERGTGGRARRPGSRRGDEEEMSESSTDEDPIVLPSRSHSFVAAGRKNQDIGLPKMARFDTQQYPRRRPGSRDGRLLHSSESSDRDITIIDSATRPSGDAARALRRVMESRRRSISGITALPPSSQTQMIRIQSAGVGRDRERRCRRQSYSTISVSTPSTVADGDLTDLDIEMCDTPSVGSSDRGDMRCVCEGREREGFMIQCDTCEHWLHVKCVKIDPRHLPKIYICAYCAETPNIRGKVRKKPPVVLSSPLNDKFFRESRR